MLRAKMRALDARPIKKVAEAKARKKMKAAQRLEKAMKKAEGVNETSDMTEREKAKQIEKLMEKGMKKGKQRKEVKVVVAKGAHKGLKGRPKGVKGRYVMVDSRMKKEVSVLAGSFQRSVLIRISRSAHKNEERKRPRSASGRKRSACVWLVFCVLPVVSLSCFIRHASTISIPASSQFHHDIMSLYY